MRMGRAVSCLTRSRSRCGRETGGAAAPSAAGGQDKLGRELGRGAVVVDYTDGLRSSESRCADARRTPGAPQDVCADASRLAPQLARGGTGHGVTCRHRLKAVPAGHAGCLGLAPQTGTGPRGFSPAGHATPAAARRHGPRARHVRPSRRSRSCRAHVRMGSAIPCPGRSDKHARTGPAPVWGDEAGGGCKR